MVVHICLACGYPALTAGICAACLPAAVTSPLSARTTAPDATGAVQLSAVVDLGAKAG